MIKIQRVMRHYNNFKWLLTDILNLPLFIKATIRIFVTITFVSNLLACLLNIVSVLGNPEGETQFGWYASKDYLVKVREAQDCQNPDRVQDLWFLWLWSVYWAVMTITTIGYGDVLPQKNYAELIFVILAMLVGVILYTLNTGRFLNALISQEVSHKMVTHDIEGITKFVKKNRVPYSMFRTLRSYLRNTRGVRDCNRGLQVVRRLSPGLRDSLARKAFRDKLHRVEWMAPLLGLTAANQHFLGSLLFHMCVVAFPPLEQVIQEGEHLGEGKKMFIVNSGLVWSRNSFVRTGGHFGEDMICHQATRYYGASCLTYVQCTTLSRADLFRVLDSCPTYSRYKAHIRYCAVLMALRHTVKQIGRRLLVVRSIARHLTEDTGHSAGIKIECCWHANPKKGRCAISVCRMLVANMSLFCSK